MSNRHAYDLYSDAEWDSVQQKTKPFSQQMKTLFREDPAIPIFVGFTVFALGAGMRQSFIERNAQKANHYMFMRVMAQGGAACAVGYSIFKVGVRDEVRAKEVKEKAEQLEKAKQQEAVNALNH